VHCALCTLCEISGGRSSYSRQGGRRRQHIVRTSTRSTCGQDEDSLHGARRTLRRMCTPADHRQATGPFPIESSLEQSPKWKCTVIYQFIYKRPTSPELDGKQVKQTEWSFCRSGAEQDPWTVSTPFHDSGLGLIVVSRRARMDKPCLLIVCLWSN